MDMIENYLSMDDFDVEGKTVLLRVDINSEVINGKVILGRKIKEHVKTLKELSERKAKIVVLSHQGRVGGEDFVTLEQHAQLLKNFMDLQYIDDIIGPAARAAIKKLDNGEVLLLDNVRLLAEETLEKTPEEHSKSVFVQRLAPLADLYINDAFPVAHRAHASVVGFPKVLDAGVGRLMEIELSALERAVRMIKRPCIYVLGGVKFEEAFSIMKFALENKKVDSILTTGIVGNSLLYAQGIIELGAEKKADKHFLECIYGAKEILEMGEEKIKYPEDVAVEVDGERKEISVDQVKPNQPIYDIGQKTIEKYSEIIKNARTMILRGPAGVYEKEAFRKGTEEILHAISSSDAFSLIGGGNTISAMEAIGMNKNKMYNTHISIAGGAFLSYLSGKPLPGIEVLKKR
jgi:phosphoglycerate kinase